MSNYNQLVGYMRRSIPSFLLVRKQMSSIQRSNDDIRVSTTLVFRTKEFTCFSEWKEKKKKENLEGFIIK